ncbi:MAG: hypothetical protein GYB51_19900 [Rhodobacteraceae bacterium]|nr:hypothetical protein [Paracoccaceae bacterium]
MSRPDPGEDPQPAPRRPRRPLRAVARLLALVLLLAVFGAGVWAGRLVLSGQPIPAPDWLRDRVTARIEAQSPGLGLSFDGLSLVFEEGWQPRVRMRNLALTLPGSGARVQLDQSTARLDGAALLRGGIAPREITVTGAQLRLRRRADGSLDLMARSPGNDRALADALDELKSALRRPELAGLRRIEGLGLTLIYEDARAERLWSADGGRLVLDRQGEELVIRGDVSLLGGRSYATLVEGSYTSRLDARAGSFQLSVADMPSEDLATQGPALAWLGVLRAPLSGALRVAVKEDGALGPLHATLQIGAGVLRPSEETRPIPFDSARSYFSFDPASQMLRFTELSLQSRWVSLLAEGAFQIGAGPSGGVEMTGQLSATDIVANPGDLFAAALRLDRAEAELRLAVDPFELSLGQLLLSEGGQSLQLSGWMRARNGWELGLEGALADPRDAAARLSPDDVLGFWPPLAKPKTRSWVSRNLLEGALSHLQFALRATEGRAPDLQLGFDFDEATLTYLRGMPPVRGARGHASLRGDRFVVRSDAGQVDVPGGGVLDVAGTTFVVPDVRVKPADGEVSLRAEGALGDALRLLDHAPLELLSKAGQDPGMASGRARAEALITMPLIKDLPMDEVEASYNARVEQVESDSLVPGRRLTADVLQVTGDKRGLTVSGAGQLDGLAFQGRFRAGLGGTQARPQVEARVTLDQAGAEALGLTLPPGTLSGQGTADLSLELEGPDVIDFRVESDLAGLGLRIPALGFALSPSGTGQLSAEGRLGESLRLDSFALEAPGLALSGDLTASPEGRLQLLSLDRLRAGGWLDISARVRPSGSGTALEVTGGRVDLAAMPDLPGGGDLPAALVLDRLEVSDGLALTGFRGQPAGGGALRFSGRVNGGAGVTGVWSPRAIRVEAADASAVLAAAGYLRQGSGGRLTLDLVPQGTPGHYAGHLEIKDLRIREAPVMAELLNALSIVGLLEQLSGPGILFSDVEADFTLSPGALVVQQASAVGASMGISLDGLYDLAGGQLQMQGVFSPLYVLNGIGALLTRKGEGLIGFNFRLDGPASDPRVRVNPLSALTPGMFREIFRRPAPGTD